MKNNLKLIKEFSNKKFQRSFEMQGNDFGNSFSHENKDNYVRFFHLIFFNLEIKLTNSF